MQTTSLITLTLLSVGTTQVAISRGGATRQIRIARQFAPRGPNPAAAQRYTNVKTWNAVGGLAYIGGTDIGNRHLLTNQLTTEGSRTRSPFQLG